MNTHKRRVRAIEDGVNINEFPGSPTYMYEGPAGWGNAPFLVDEEDFPPGLGRPDPKFNENGDRFNSNLVVSRRLNRIARQMIKNGFRGA